MKCILVSAKQLEMKQLAGNELHLPFTNETRSKNETEMKHDLKMKNKMEMNSKNEPEMNNGNEPLSKKNRLRSSPKNI